jgi:hypothetical protein
MRFWIPARVSPRTRRVLRRPELASSMGTGPYLASKAAAGMSAEPADVNVRRQARAHFASAEPRDPRAERGVGEARLILVACANFVHALLVRALRVGH